jgi:serine/threonine-protein kinase RsbW
VKIKTNFSHEIRSDLAEVDGICREARALLAAHGQAGAGFSTELLLRELLNNAILHGNGLDDHKRVKASVRIGRKWIQLRIADEGPGFDWRSARQVLPDADAVSGRGLAITMLYARRIRFNRLGNQVTIWIEKSDE